MNNRKFCGISLEEIKQYAVVASVLAAILFGGLYNPQVSQAGENLWMYTQGTDTRPKGSTELKWGTIGRFGKYSGDYSFYDHRPEIEYGITDKLTVSGELMIFSHNYSVDNAENDPMATTQRDENIEGDECITDPEGNGGSNCRYNRTSFGGYELNAKYNFLSPYKDVLGLTGRVGFEGRERYRLDGANIEQKTIHFTLMMQKNWMDDRLVLAGNHKMELERRKGADVLEEEIAFDTSVGISYRYKPKHFVGFEVRRQADYLAPFTVSTQSKDDNLEYSNWDLTDFSIGTNHQYGIYMGPSYHYAEKDWWVTTGIMFQTWGGSGSGEAFVRDGKNYDEHESVHIGLTVGYEM